MTRTSFEVAQDAEAVGFIYATAVAHEARDSVRYRMRPEDAGLWERWMDSKLVSRNALAHLLRLLHDLEGAGLGDVAANMLEQARHKADLANHEAIATELKTCREAA